MIPYNKRQDAQIVKIKDYINGKGKYVTGEGTSITLKNTVNTPFNNIILKGNTSQNTTTGKNLIKLYKATNPLVIKGLTVTRLDDNTLKINGTSEEQCWIEFIYDFKNETVVQTTPLFKLNLDKKYVCIGKNISGTKDKDIRIVFQISKEGNVGAAGAPNMSISIANADGIYRGWIAIPVSTNFNNYTLQFQLEEGTTPTDFEPYTNGVSPNPDYPQEIKVVTGDNQVKVVGKNKIEGFTFYDDPINYGWGKALGNSHYSHTISNGELVLTAGGDIGGSLNFYLSSLAKVREKGFKKNTKYTMSADVMGTLTGNMNNEISLIYNQKTLANDGWYKPGNVKSTTKYDNIIKADSWNRVSVTFQTPDNNDELYLFVRFSCMGTVHFRHIQIEESDTATTYEPYHEQNFPISLGDIELAKIDDYQDYMYKKDNKWYKHKVISKRICYPTDVGSKLEGTTKAYQFGSLNDALMSNSFYREKGFCDISYNNMEGQMYGDKDGYGWNIEKEDNVNNNFNIRFDKEKFPNLDTIKNYFKDKGVTFYYILATPTEEEITDTTLINQLDTLEQAVSYDDTTNISQTNADLPFIINAEAVKKLL